MEIPNDGTNTKFSDIDLVRGVKSGKDADFCITELINRHGALCNNVLTKYSNVMMATGVPLSDIYAEKEYLVYDAVKTFNEEKGVKFSTWLANSTRYYCLNTINKAKPVGEFIDNTVIEEKIDINYQNLPPSQCKKTQNLEYVFHLLNQLKDKRIKKIFELRYIVDGKRDWKSVGRKMRITNQACIDLHRKGMKLIRAKMNSDFRSDDV